MDETQCFTRVHSSPFSSILHKDKKVLGLRNASFPKQEGQGISIVLGENVFKYNDSLSQKKEKIIDRLVPLFFFYMGKIRMCVIRRYCNVGKLPASG